MAVGDSALCEMPEDEFGVADSPEASTSASALSEGGAGDGLGWLVENALLVFPFFAWGSSMPALKLVQPHVPFPLLLGALRLLPAGVVLVAWAAATGRKHPTSPKAWAWIMLFALVDGAAFQVCMQQVHA